MLITKIEFCKMDHMEATMVRVHLTGGLKYQIAITNELIAMANMQELKNVITQEILSGLFKELDKEVYEFMKDIEIPHPGNNVTVHTFQMSGQSKTVGVPFQAGGKAVPLFPTVDSPNIQSVVEKGNNVTDELIKHLPDLNTIVGCPHKDCIGSGKVIEVVIHLNDKHQDSREKIADWLETLDININFGVNNEV